MATAALLAILVIFSAAQAHGQTAAVAATTANLNQRAGPGTHFPVLRVVPAGSQMTLYGCIGGYTWCDGVFAGSRGWFSATYLRVWYQGQYVPVAQYASLTSFPTVAFNLEAYWGRYYPNQPFYPDRAQWVSPGPSQGIQVGHFYNRLSPHGRWVWMNGQYVFVPIVNADWRPYTDGRWVWNQRYGWTWVSNEPFGWATYHYGRWGYSHRIGWFWVPGTRWAPAWVSWRYSGNTIAWAPLPPDPTDSFSFGVSYGNIPNYYWQPVPANLFLSINLNFNIIRDEQQKAQVLAETQEAGGVTEDDNAVVNQVLPVELVEQVTQEEVVPVEIALTSDPEAETTEADAGTVQIFTPPAEEATQAEPEEVAEIETVEAESTTAGQAPADEPDTEELVPPAPPPGETPPPSEAPPVVDEPTAMDAVPADAIAPDEIVCPEGTELDANGECVPVTALPPPPLEEEPVTLPAEEAPPAPPADAAPPPPPPAEEAPPATEETPPPPPAEELPPAPAPAEEPPPPAEAPPPPPAPAEEPPPPPPPPAEEPPPPPVVDEAPPPPPPADEPPCPEGYVLLPDGTCALPEE